MLGLGQWVEQCSLMMLGCDRARVKIDIGVYISCSKALVCCGHNVLCLNKWSLGDRVDCLR